MTIRSAPPASSPFAERPVPAPAPMIGSPRAFIAWKRARMSERATRDMPLSLCPATDGPAAEQSAKFGDDFRRKARVVDMHRQPDQAPRSGLPNGGLDRSEKLRVGIRVRKRPAWRVEGRDPA